MKNKGLFIPDNILRDNNLSLQEKLILSVYNCFTDNYISQKEVASYLGISFSHLRNKLTSLRKKGYLCTEKSTKNVPKKVQKCTEKSTQCTELSTKQCTEKSTKNVLNSVQKTGVSTSNINNNIKTIKTNNNIILKEKEEKEKEKKYHEFLDEILNEKKFMDFCKQKFALNIDNELIEFCNYNDALGKITDNENFKKHFINYLQKRTENERITEERRKQLAENERNAIRRNMDIQILGQNQVPNQRTGGLRSNREQLQQLKEFSIKILQGNN